MTTILIRTLIIYLILTCVMRLMGKRQIGQLEISDLVSTLILSEIATIPLENQDIPITNALIPIITITTIEIISSFIIVKFPRLKNMILPQPSILIEKGIINQKELIKSRISAEELIAELRQNSISDISDVNYAILEKNGKISIIQKSELKPATLKDLKIPADENGMMRIIISNGYVNLYNLEKCKKDTGWLKEQMKSNDCSCRDVFLFMSDDRNNVYLVKKDFK